MSVGGAATGDGAGGVARTPWPNAAERAAARRAAQDAIERSRARRTAEPDPVEAVAPPDDPVAPLAARPRIEDDTYLLGLTRRSHSRLGQRVFTLFFVFVFLLIAVQMVVALLSE